MKSEKFLLQLVKLIPKSSENIGSFQLESSLQKVTDSIYKLLLGYLCSRLKIKKMRNYKLIFWISTGFFSAFMLFSAFGYLTSEEMKAAFTHFGFPADSFRIQLAIAKILGVAALILPFMPRTLKGMAYAGFTINLVSALIAHVANSYHSYGLIIFATITLVLSYYSYLKIRKNAALA